MNETICPLLNDDAVFYNTSWNKNRMWLVAIVRRQIQYNLGVTLNSLLNNETLSHSLNDGILLCKLEKYFCNMERGKYKHLVRRIWQPKCQIYA